MSNNGYSGNELIINRSKYPKDATVDEITCEISNKFSNFSLQTDDLHLLVTGAEKIIALVGKGRGLHRVSNAIKDAILHSNILAKEFYIFSTITVLVKLLYPINHPIKICETTCILNLNALFFDDSDGKEFKKLYEEESDDLEPSHVIADTRELHEIRVGESNSWHFKCSASEKESDDSEITALILASNLY